MQQDLDRIKTGINGRRQRPPVGFGLPNELSWRGVTRNQVIESRNRKTSVAKIEQEKQKNGCVGTASQSKPPPPFDPLNKLGAPLSPTVRQEVEFNRRRRRLDADKFGRPRQNSLHSVAQLVTGFVEQDIWKRRINTL